MSDTNYSALLRFHSFLFDVFDLVDPFVAHLAKLLPLEFGGDGVRFTAIHQAQIGCGVVVGLESERFLQELNSRIDGRFPLGGVARFEKREEEVRSSLFAPVDSLYFSRNSLFARKAIVQSITPNQ